MRVRLAWAVVAGLSLAPLVAQAHHSFAVYFDPSRSVTITGKVAAFRPITIEGWASRDDKPYMRLRRALDANGKLIGTAPFGTTDSG